MLKAQRALHLYSSATACATFFLLIAGSLVTSNDAGLAVPDWPLSYGTWFPPMVGGIFYEHGHRMVAGTVGIMILILAVWLSRAEPRSWVKHLGFLALAAVFIQALLGGLTVLLLLPPQVSIAHACLGQIVFCLVACLGLATSPQWQENALPWQEAPKHLRLLGMAAACFAALQLVLGAVIRHTAATAYWHMWGAAALAAVSLGYFLESVNKKNMPVILRQGAFRLLGLVVLQISLGAFVFFNRNYVPARTLHLGIGALVLASAVVLAWQTARHIPKSFQ